MSWSAALNHELIRKKTGEYEKEKGTGSEAKKMGNERMGENEEICLLENI